MPDPLIINKAGQPGIHALIVGVSEYRHLPPAEGIQGDPEFGMKRLSSPALSAFRFYQWLLERDAESKLVLPLKTCRLLLSPSAKEKQAEPALAALTQVPPGGFADFKTAAIEWRKDALSGKDDMTVFYFGGHGLWSTPTETILASADFLEPPTATPLERCVSFQNIKKGMAPQIGFGNISLTQLYFIDCCRNFPEYLADVTEPTTGTIFDIKANTNDKRRLSIFYSTVPGNLAMGVSGRESVFCEALLHALDKAVDKEQAFSSGVWPVTTDHLKRAIEVYLARRYNILDDLPPEALAARATICYLDGPPKIDLTIDVGPPAARAGAKITLFNFDNGQDYPVGPDPNGTSFFVARMPMGLCKLTVQPASNAFKLYARPRFVQYDVELPWRAMLI